MPVIPEPDTWDLCMKGEPNTAAALMKPANEDVLVSRAVSKAVNSVKNNGPELLERAEWHRNPRKRLNRGRIFVAFPRPRQYPKNVINSFEKTALNV